VSIDTNLAVLNTQLDRIYSRHLCLPCINIVTACSGEFSGKTVCNSTRVLVTTAAPHLTFALALRLRSHNPCLLLSAYLNDPFGAFFTTGNKRKLYMNATSVCTPVCLFPSSEI